MWRHIASNALTMFVVLLVLAGGVIIWGKSQYTGPGPLAEAICLRVEPGSNMERVSKDLSAQGAISNQFIFEAGADYEKKSGSLKKGSFLVPANTSMQDIVDQITTSARSTCGTEVIFRIRVGNAKYEVRELDPATNRYVEIVSFDSETDAVPAEYVDVTGLPDIRYRVVLAEGVTSWQVTETLKRADFLTGDVDVPAEGSLAPDSYEVARGATRGELVARMQAAQEEILAEAWQGRVDGLPINTPEEALILASIIEKETGIADERRQVASVFINRLNQGIRLQTDPTVIYGVTNGQGALGRGLRQSELRRETPYNTYVIDGLPPTPIANPGRAAIEAALNPDETPYVFFVAKTLDPADGHVFAETLSQHNDNVAKLRALEAQRGDN